MASERVKYQLKYDGSKEDIEWLMWYTGWIKQIAISALKQWSKPKSKE